MAYFLNRIKIWIPFLQPYRPELLSLFTTTIADGIYYYIIRKHENLLTSVVAVLHLWLRECTVFRDSEYVWCSLLHNKWKFCFQIMMVLQSNFLHFLCMCVHIYMVYEIQPVIVPNGYSRLPLYHCWYYFGHAPYRISPHFSFDQLKLILCILLLLFTGRTVSRQPLQK